MKLTAFSKCDCAISTFFVWRWRSLPSERCVRAWIAGDGWNWNTDWRHCIHCLILGGLDVLNVSASPKSPTYEASWLLPAAILFLFCAECPRSSQRFLDYVVIITLKFNSLAGNFKIISCGLYLADFFSVPPSLSPGSQFYRGVLTSALIWMHTLLSFDTFTEFRYTVEPLYHGKTTSLQRPPDNGHLSTATSL